MRLIEANEERRRDMMRLSHGEAVTALLHIHDILWPREDPTLCFAWSEETAEKIAAVLEIATEDHEERP